MSYDGKFALRWAVLAAGYASLSTDQDDIRVQNTALECYGRALSALGKALADPKVAPDDHVLMSIVILDLFEASNLLNVSDMINDMMIDDGCMCIDTSHA